MIVKNNPSFGNKGKLGNVSIQVLKEIQGKIINLSNNLSENIISPQIPNGQTEITTESIQTSNINSFDHPDNEKTIKRIKKFYKRLNHKINSKKVFEFHEQNGTVPEKLSIFHFPPAFLDHDIIFVESYNTLIKEFQQKISKLCTSRLNDQINKIKSDIMVEKDKLSDKIDTNLVNEKMAKISDDAENNSRPSLDKALEKARRMIIKEVIVKQNRTDENDSIDENWFTEPDYRNKRSQNNHLSRSKTRNSHHSNNRNWSRFRNTSNASRNRSNSNNNYYRYKPDNNRHYNYNYRSNRDNSASNSHYNSRYHNNNNNNSRYNNSNSRYNNNNSRYNNNNDNRHDNYGRHNSNNNR